MENGDLRALRWRIVFHGLGIVACLVNVYPPADTSRQRCPDRLHQRAQRIEFWLRAATGTSFLTPRGSFCVPQSGVVPIISVLLFVMEQRHRTINASTSATNVTVRL